MGSSNLKSIIFSLILWNKTSGTIWDLLTKRNSNL